MTKPLSEMSLKELWQLFPIFLVPHKNEWETWYSEEETLITALFPKEMVVRISHIGSTAILSLVFGLKISLIYCWKFPRMLICNFTSKSC